MATQIIKRALARAQDLKRYFTGKPCKRGHLAERFVKNLTCVTCDREKQKRNPWHKKNPERHNEFGKQSYRRHRQKRLERQRQRRVTNPEFFRQKWNAIPPEIRKTRARNFYLKNQDRQRQYLKDWEAKNIEKVRERKLLLTRRRRAQKLMSHGQHTRADLADILKTQSNCCAYCRVDQNTKKKNVDHIIPLAMGGANDRSNLQYTCRECNLSKGAKDPIVFAKEIGRLL